MNNKYSITIFNEAMSGSQARAMGSDSKGKRWEDYDTIKCLDGTIIDMVDLMNEQAKAKAALVHLEPIFANFVNKLNTIYTFRIETQATDGYYLFVNPEFTYHLTFEEKVFLIAHECMHCVLDHMRRGKEAGHEPMKSNIAADYEVNQTLVDIGLFKEATIKKLGGLIDSKYSGWSFEHIYDSNPSGSKESNEPDEPQKSQSGQQNNQSSQGNQSNSDKDSEHSADYKEGWNQAMADYKSGKLKIK